MSDGGELQHVYFQKPLKVTKHWEGRREIKMAWDDMMYHVNRTNAEEKLRDFLVKQEQLIDMVNHQAMLDGLHDQLSRVDLNSLEKHVLGSSSPSCVVS